jgi:hypothetical protein
VAVIRIVISDDAAVFVKRIARERGISEPTVIRNALEVYRLHLQFKVIDVIWPVR